MTGATTDRTGTATEGRDGNPLPRQVGSYHVLRLIGRGGMGVVYEAEHLVTGQRVALKTVGATNAPTLMAIRTEIMASGAVRHPGVIRILDEGIHEGLPWYAMELLEGRTIGHFNREIWPGSGDHPVTASTLSGVFASSRPTSDLLFEAGTTVSPGMLPEFGGAASFPTAAGRLKEVAALYRLLCAPLGHIHARGMVHRDLKPSNVCIRSDGTPVIMDFGLMSLARGGVGREALSVGGSRAGTVSYVAPEQIQGRFVDARADLYALGCMLYETLTGRPPFVGERASQILDGHLSVPPVPPSGLVSGVPALLDELILRLLSKRPQDRLGHTDDVAAILWQIAEDKTVGPPPGETDHPCHLYRPQLVGRHDILTELLDCLNKVTQGQGALVLVGGESGIGKTFLVSEFGRSAAQRGVQVVTGECLPTLGTDGSTSEPGGGPLLPFRRLLQIIADQCREKGLSTTQRLLGSRAALLAPYEPALARLATDAEKPETLPSQAARDRLLGCMEETLGAFAAEGPLLLILDDLQWADDLSLALLMSLRPTFFEKRPLLILGTFRQEEASLRLGELINGTVARPLTLGRLDRNTIRSIVGEMLAITDPPAGLVDFLTHTSEGNPFFVAEYLRLLVAEGVLHRRSGRWVLAGDVFDEAAVEALPIPRSLQGIINRRLDGLSDEARAVVRAGAVLGREFDLQLLADTLCLEVPAILASLREAVVRRILEETEDGRYRFVHDKLLETCYQLLPTDRRQRLHAEAARAIESRLSDPSPRPHALAELAHHFAHAGNRSRALEFMEKAGNEALGKSANREAASFFKQALDLADVEGMEVGRQRRARWSRQVGDALQGIGLLDESAVYFRRAVAILGWPPPGPGWLSQGAAVASQLLQQFFHRIFPWLFLARWRHKSEELLEAARAYDRLQQVLYYQGHAILPMLHACVASLNLAERASPSVELATAYSNAHAVATLVPAHGLAEAYLRRARETLAQTSDSVGVADSNADTYLSVVAGFRWAGLGAWSLVNQELGRTFALARRIGFRRRSEEIAGIRGAAQFLSGDFQGALSSADLQYESAMRGDVQTQCWSRLGRAQVFLIQDRLDGAEIEITQAAALAAKIGRAEQIWADALWARLWLCRGDLTRAAEHADRAMRKIAAKPPVPVYCVHAYSVVAEVRLTLWERGSGSGQQEERRLEREAARACKVVARDSARLYRTARPSFWLLEGTRAWLLGKHGRATRYWRRSLDLAQKLVMPYDEARAHVALARGSSSEETLARVDQAAGLFERLGARYDLRQLQGNRLGVRRTGSP